MGRVAFSVALLFTADLDTEIGEDNLPVLRCGAEDGLVRAVVKWEDADDCTALRFSSLNVLALDLSFTLLCTRLTSTSFCIEALYFASIPQASLSTRTRGLRKLVEPAEGALIVTDFLFSDIGPLEYRDVVLGNAWSVMDLSCL